MNPKWSFSVLSFPLPGGVKGGGREEKRERRKEGEKKRGREGRRILRIKRMGVDIFDKTSKRENEVFPPFSSVFIEDQK
jgi:hypothetical protein